MLTISLIIIILIFEVHKVCFAGSDSIGLTLNATKAVVFMAI